MTITSVRPGDVVAVDKRGRVFHALVVKLIDGGLSIQPFERGVTYYKATAREITGIWHPTKPTRRTLGVA